MAEQPYRLPRGGLVDRSRTLAFRFAGRALSGHPGDTLASALLANGEHLVARSFKYHRPRGILSAGAEEPAALVEIGDDRARSDPNTRVTEQELYEGLKATPQNCWPSLKYDLGAVNDLIAPFIPAGFYYKTFKGWPGWMRFEPMIRRAAGLGRAPAAPDPDRYEAVNRHCDVLVVGGGPAGLMAALAAGRAGARVILCEETAALGGTLLSRDPEVLSLDDAPPADWVAGIEAELEAMAEVTMLTRTTAFGYYAQNFVGLWERVADHIPEPQRPARTPRQKLWRVRAKEVVLATGSIERPLVFHENDRPGIMLAGAVRTYMHRYGVLPGKRIVVATNNDSGWDAALDIARMGGEVAAVVDLRGEMAPVHLAEAARLGIAIYGNATIAGTSGATRISGVAVRPLKTRAGEREAGRDRMRSSGRRRRLGAERRALRAIARETSLRRDDRGVPSGPLVAARALGRRGERLLRHGRMLCRRRPRRRRGGEGGGVRGGNAARFQPCRRAGRSGRGRSASFPSFPRTARSTRCAPGSTSRTT